MLARVMRAISAAKTMPSANVGITMCDRNGPNPAPIVTKPCTGRRSVEIAKT